MRLVPIKDRDENVVATWNPAANSNYYLRQSAYYLDGCEPRGVWHAPAGDLGVRDGASIERDEFERLFAARSGDGASLLTSAGGAHARVPAFDITLSAPRSVALLWALGDDESRAAIETAQARAVRSALEMLEREACFARRGKGGNRIEPVPLTTALFQHGESRPAEHMDGKIFSDPNLHTHCVCISAATRADGTVGALHSIILRNFKLSCGALYHAALAAELQKYGFALDCVGRNGVFEIAGVPDEAIRYFSARRSKIEAELREAGTTSGEAAALAAAIARSSRGAKSSGAEPREAVWREAAARIGFDVAPIFARQREYRLDLALGERLLAERLAALPRTLTETKSVVDRRELVRSVAEALVGTGVGAERVEPIVTEMIGSGEVVELARDALGQPRYSTPEIMRIEREVVALADRLVREQRWGLAPDAVRSRCNAFGLSAEQTEAALATTGPERLAVIQGAPGTGKTTTLSPVVEAWTAAGYRIVGTASAWKVANMLRDDLKIEARATASWLRRAELGQSFLDEKSVLIVDEVGLLSSRDMHALLSAVDRAGARMIALGDLGQLQSIGAGSGLKLLAGATKGAHVTAIVRQRQAWAREAVTELGRGEALAALERFRSHDRFIVAEGQRAAIRAVVDAVEADIIRDSPGSALLIAKTNAEVAAIGLEVRQRMRACGLVTGADVPVDAVTPSGHPTRIAIAMGDRVRFLARNDGIGVINGSTATVIRVLPVIHPGCGPEQPRHARIEAMIEGRLVDFDTRDLADDRGRARINWGYATTIYGAQGATVDRAAVLLSSAFDRHDVYVAASRSRETTTLVVDQRMLDRQVGVRGAAAAAHPHAAEAEGSAIDADARLTFLAAQLSRANVKETTLDFVPMQEIAEAETEPTDPALREVDRAAAKQQSPQIGMPASNRDGQRPQLRRELDLEL